MTKEDAIKYLEGKLEAMKDFRKYYADSVNLRKDKIAQENLKYYDMKISKVEWQLSVLRNR